MQTKIMWNLMYRNKKLLEACRQLPCQLCHIEDGTVIAAHSNQLLDGKGKGIKASDYRVAALCFTCHMDLDQGNKLSKNKDGSSGKWRIVRLLANCLNVG